MVIVTPEGREQFISYCEKYRVPYKSIYIDIDRDTQRRRLTDRGDAMFEIARRKKDFDIITPSERCIKIDGNKSVEDIYILIKQTL